MTKTQIHIRASDATREKLEALAQRYGTKTEAVAVAVDRLHNSEIGGREMFRIDRDKLAEVVALFNAQVDPRAEDHIIRAEICADWNEGDEHQDWIDNASAQEIVDWLASFYDN